MGGGARQECSRKPMSNRPAPRVFSKDTHAQVAPGLMSHLAFLDLPCPLGALHLPIYTCTAHTRLSSLKWPTQLLLSRPYHLLTFPSLHAPFSPLVHAQVGHPWDRAARTEVTETARPQRGTAWRESQKCDIEFVYVHLGREMMLD